MALKKIGLSLLVGSFLAIAVWGYHNVLQKPFPFVHISYVEDKKLFDAPPNTFELNITLPLSAATCQKMRNQIMRFEKQRPDENDLEHDIRTIVRTVQYLMAHSASIKVAVI